MDLLPGFSTRCGIQVHIGDIKTKVEITHFKFKIRQEWFIIKGNHTSELKEISSSTAKINYDVTREELGSS